MQYGAVIKWGVLEAMYIIATVKATVSRKLEQTTITVTRITLIISEI